MSSSLLLQQRLSGQLLSISMHDDHIDFLQREGVENHQEECLILAQRPLSTITRLMARIMMKLRHQEVPSEEVCGKLRSWNHFMDHYEEVIHDASAMIAFNDIFLDLEKILGQDLDIKSTISVYGKVLVNSFAIQDELLRPVGRAVYLGASIFDHSCCPNASFIFVGKTIYIKALREISGDPVENVSRIFIKVVTDVESLHLLQVRICYLDELDCSQERRNQLAANYYFQCDCDRCVSNEI